MIKIKLNQIFTFLCILIVLSSCTAIYENGKEMAEGAKASISELTADELRAKLEAEEEFQIIDVREPAEYKKGSIPGSLCIPRGVLEFKIGDDAFWEEEFLYTPLKEDEIVIYCKAGDRGILATKSLLELGYTNVKNLHGGIIAWDPELTTGSGAPAEEGGCGG
ncbi:MAG: rhodanese-like domain-containing protein [Bacteroidales bacterium]|nr:rhodanese-like domain-containing protein [Bacteroidales bacterium]